MRIQNISEVPDQDLSAYTATGDSIFNRVIEEPHSERKINVGDNPDESTEDELNDVKQVVNEINEDVKQGDRPFIDVTSEEVTGPANTNSTDLILRDIPSLRQLHMYNFIINIENKTVDFVLRQEHMPEDMLKKIETR